ncbi:hypothetical protein HS7_11390 [Sulfolobales archaeon HS-7]|nr:hypothetical protein HS7_11390 [Sulfolobales archaeon HS-7]
MEKSYKEILQFNIMNSLTQTIVIVAIILIIMGMGVETYYNLSSHILKSPLMAPSPSGVTLGASFSTLLAKQNCNVSKSINIIMNEEEFNITYVPPDTALTINSTREVFPYPVILVNQIMIPIKSYSSLPIEENVNNTQITVLLKDGYIYVKIATYS